jgi:hypothetical protein
MHNSGLWNYSDEENLGPPIDYHEVRGHLRIGTVHIIDSGLLEKVANGREVSRTEDLSIREAVYNAVMLISELSGRNRASQMHYLFWNIFRSCCTREDPHCKICPSSCTLPDRYVPLAIRSDGSRRCPFAEVCASAESDIKLLEHKTTTEYF